MPNTTRVVTHGLLTDDSGRVLLHRVTARWSVPGSDVAHGEHPVDALRRGFTERTGLSVEPTGPVAAPTVVVDSAVGDSEHVQCLVYRVTVTGGRLHDRFDAGTGENLWRHPDDLAGQPLGPVPAAILGLDPAPSTVTEYPLPPVERRNPRALTREQRVGAYAWLTDPAGRVLLTMVPPGYWASGRWHLAGGGVDFGEDPARAVAREIVEETSQHAELGPLELITSHHDPRSTGPGGAPVDFHGIGLVYRGLVPEPGDLVIRDVGGSTSQVRWFDAAEIPGLPQTFVVLEAYRRFAVP